MPPTPPETTEKTLIVKSIADGWPHCFVSRLQSAMLQAPTSHTSSVHTCQLGSQRAAETQALPAKAEAQSASVVHWVPSPGTAGEPLATPESSPAAAEASAEPGSIPGPPPSSPFCAWR